MRVYHCGCFLLSCLPSAGVWVLDESELRRRVVCAPDWCFIIWNVTIFLSFHTQLLSPSLLVFMFSPTCYFSLWDIALWYCFTLVSFLFCFSISELSSENMRTCFQIINAYIYLSATDFLQVGGKKTSNKQTFKDGNGCVNNLICTSEQITDKSEQTRVWCSNIFFFTMSDFYRDVLVCRTF